jgi:hypothetical protein
MVAEGVLKPQQAVELLIRQLKRAQKREDDELRELLCREQALSEDDIKQCAREQRRQEAEGHARVLRQIIVETNALPAPRLRELLRKKMREDVEAHLLQWEEGRGIAAGGILPDEEELKLDESEVCPACGKAVPVAARTCPSCDHPLEPAPAGAAEPNGAPPPKAGAAAKAKGRKREDTSQWEIHLQSGAASRPLRFATLVQLVREKRVTATTVLRGPLTLGVWRQARHTPRLCRLFGTCHYCEAKLPANAKRCPACQTDPDRPREG